MASSDHFVSVRIFLLWTVFNTPQKEIGCLPSMDLLQLSSCLSGGGGLRWYLLLLLEVPWNPRLFSRVSFSCPKSFHFFVQLDQPITSCAWVLPFDSVLVSHFLRCSHHRTTSRDVAHSGSQVALVSPHLTMRVSYGSFCYFCADSAFSCTKGLGRSHIFLWCPWRSLCQLWWRCGMHFFISRHKDCRIRLAVHNGERIVPKFSDYIPPPLTSQN